MAVTLFATDADGENYVANTTTMQFTVPAGVQQDDIIEFAVSLTLPTATTMTPSLSTAVLMPSYASGDANLLAQSWYYRVPSTIPTTITVTLSVARQGSLTWRVWRGINTTTALDATPTVFSNATPQASIAAPSITTTTANAYVCAQIYNGSGADGVTLASGWTLDVDASRRNGIMVKKGVQAVAGASGSATFPWTSGSYTGRAFVIAWRAAAGAVAPTLVGATTGLQLQDELHVNTQTTDATSVRIKWGTNAAVTTGVVYTSGATPDADGFASHTITGLTPGVQYYGMVEMTGSSTVLSALAVKGKTLPDGTAPWSLKIGVGSCHDILSGTDSSTSYTRLLARAIDMFWHLGDFHYADNASTSQASHRADLLTQISTHAPLKQIIAEVPTYAGKSDHCGGGGNDAPAGVWTAPNRAAHLQVFATTNRPNADGLYCSIVIPGRARFIFIDCRYFATQGVSRTRLGATQLAWLKAELAQPEVLKVLVMEGTWIDDRAPATPDDSWNYYSVERDDIADSWASDGVGTLVAVGGDQHALSADDGTNNFAGGFPVIGAAPFHNDSSFKTANPASDWTQGRYPLTEGVSVSQHGYIEITDDLSDVTLAFTGYDSSNTSRVTMTVVAEGSAALVGSAADSVGVSDTASAGVVRPRTQADAVGVTDAASDVLAAVRAQADTVGATDAVTALLARTAGAADGVGVSDTASFVVAAARAQGDGVGVSDLASAVLARTSAPVDGVAVTDSVSTARATGQVVVDTAAVTDSITVTLGGAEAAFDGVGVTDVATRALAAGRSSMDTAGASDQVAVSMSATRTQPDTIGVTDSVSVSMAGAGEANPVDGVGVTDAVSVVMSRVHTVADFLGIVDSASNGSGAAVTESDDVGVSDAITRALTRPRDLTDGVGLTDAASSVRGYSRPLTDPVGVSDSAVAVLDRVLTVTLADTVGVFDTAYVQTVLPEAAPDLFTLTGITLMLTLTPEEP